MVQPLFNFNLNMIHKFVSFCQEILTRLTSVIYSSLMKTSIRYAQFQQKTSILQLVITDMATLFHPPKKLKPLKKMIILLGSLAILM